MWISISFAVLSYGNADTQFRFDIDQDGQSDALVDGLLVLRHLFGFTDRVLTNGIIDTDSVGKSASEIEIYLNENVAELDIDGDGNSDALTDGLLLLRYFFGFRNDLLVSGALADTAIRVTSNDISSYVLARLDTDLDGVSDYEDSFVMDATEWLDTDKDGIGNNADIDDDGDGIFDDSDAYPLIDLGNAVDTDADGIPNECDVSCVSAGMTADVDDDGDGILDTADTFSLIAIGNAVDTDGDGAPDTCAAACLVTGMTADTDDDGDGVPDTIDAFPLLSVMGETDTDADGAPDACEDECLATGMTADIDDDNDGLLDPVDAFPLVSIGDETDTDGDGAPDACNADCLDTGMTADADDDGDFVVDSEDVLPLVDAFAMARVDSQLLGYPSEAVTKLLDAIFLGDQATQAAMILKSGYVIGERYAEDRGAQDLVTSWSVAKSFYSMAIGIALDEGRIPSLDSLASEWLTEWQGTAKESITIRQILSMRSGLLPAGANNSVGGEELFFSEDQTAFALARPVEYEPGSAFQYVNSTAQLMEPLLERSTGMEANAYLYEKLLRRIGVDQKTVGLWVDQTGNSLTYCCIDMRIEDFSRFGLLVLSGGLWRGERIVPASYIANALSPWVGDSNSYYGWKWWILNDAFFDYGSMSNTNELLEIFTGVAPMTAVAALGYQGQSIYVFPQNDLVVSRFSLNNHEPGQGYVVSTQETINFPDTCTARNLCSWSEGEPVSQMGMVDFLSAIGEFLQSTTTN
ncbi:MAG: serine hydrolase [Pseudomonadota bacterium]|nr:serine hydrolase [Pseudomonadota bacterium]